MEVAMSNADYFFEGKRLPEDLKNSIYRMENASSNLAQKSLFEEILASLLEEFMHKKKIALTKVEKYQSEKLRSIKAYVLFYENENGDQFKCSLLCDRDSLKFGTSNILASAILFAFAEYGCKYCNYKDEDCEYCERSKLDKIFTPENKLSLRHNMDGLEKVFGKESLDSVKDFCQGYYEYIRSNGKISQEDEEIENESAPKEIKQFLEVDENIIAYITKTVSTILGEYANGNKDIKNILSDYENVEKSFMLVLQHLQRLHAFIVSVKDSPNDIPEEILETLRQSDEFDLNYDEDDEDDEDDDESWESESEEEDE